MSTFTQNSFVSGSDQLAPEHQIDVNGYKMLVNGRQRLGYIEPNNQPTEIDTIPDGHKQGGIALENIAIVFIEGKAWYNVDGSSHWTRILPFQMDADVDRLYSIAIPAGPLNVVRKLDATADINKPIRKTYDFTVAGTPAAIVVQDGINQPWLIIFDPNSNTFSSRTAKTYNQWSNTDGTLREYVPIGKQMIIVDSKLLIQSVDSKSLYQSVSGRYLDFMVNIDVNGNKLATEAQGGVTSVSYAFDADEINCITAIDVPSSFISITKRFTRIITLDYTRLVFGEPLYFVAAIFKVGAVNGGSVVDILGDTAIIDFEGVKSFNAVRQIMYEGNNSIFSLQLSRILKKIKQYRSQGVNFDNFGIFSIDTTLGTLLAIYDNLLERWVSYDITVVGAVKQFFIIELENESKLYAVTWTDKLFHLYSSTDIEGTQLYTRTFVAQDDGGNVFSQKPEAMTLFFQDGHTDATVVLTEFVDGKRSKRLVLNLPENIAGITPPIYPPMVPGNKPKSQPLTFKLADDNSLKGHRLNYIIQWNSDAKLLGFELKTEDEIPMLAHKQQEANYASNQ